MYKICFSGERRELPRDVLFILALVYCTQSLDVAVNNTLSVTPEQDLLAFIPA